MLPPWPGWDGLHPLVTHFPVALLLVQMESAEQDPLAERSFCYPLHAASTSATVFGIGGPSTRLPDFVTSTSSSIR